MSSALFRSVVDKAEVIDTALKCSLLERVNDCVKELQLKCTAERSNTLCNDEATNSFLWVLEAIFIHGLSNSFLKSKITPFSSLLTSLASSSASALGRDSSPAVPNPSFWEFVLVFLHRDIIDQINSLHLIHSDVGRCRAWLRIALNEGLLQSFLDNMTLKSNRRCLKAFYRSSAFLRDPEKCDILKNYLMGIELLQFRLVINNSFLNHWNSGPLSLVGLWVDENESVQQGVDVANNIESKEFQAIPKLHQRQNNSITSTPPRFYSELDSVLKKQPPPLLSEDDALRIILSSSPRSPQTPVVNAGNSRGSVSKDKPKSTSKTDLVAKKHSSLQSVKKESTRSLNSSSKNDKSSSSPHVKAKDSMSPREKQSKPSSESPTTNSSSLINGTDSDGAPMVENDLGENAKELEVKVTLASPIECLRKGNMPVMSSSPAVLGVPDLPSQFSTSVSSIEPESPTTPAGDEEEKSYANMLLDYQQRNMSCVVGEIEIDEEMTFNEEESRDHNDFTGSLKATSTSSGISKTKKTSSRSGTTHSGSTNRRQQSHYSSEQLSELLLLFRQMSESKEISMELIPRISKFAKVIANEVGLDTQNYACQMCSTSIGMIYGEARLCNFTGALYCASCHLNQEKTIPARILLNWDFGHYPVCKEAHDFLENLKNEAIFDVQEINPSIYTQIDEFSQTKSLRTKLFYIGMYLKTCKNTKALEQLKDEALNLGNKGHLLDSIHCYSLSDLLEIPNRSFINIVTKLVSTGSGHILSCTICREKGFICEVCRRPQVIFPFELEKIFKCGGCGAVYHNTCMDFSKNCPRCERWKKNEAVLYNDVEDLEL